MSAMIRNAERQYVVETTMAVHSDCGQPFVWDRDRGCFACQCSHPDDRLLDTRDIYIEWDERWDFGVAGELLSHRLEYPECWECGDRLTAEQVEDGLTIHPACYSEWVK